MMAPMAATNATRPVSAWVVLRAIFWSLVFVGFFILWIPGRGFGVWQALAWPPSARAWVGLLLIAAGMALATACIAAFARHGGGTPAPMDAPRELVVRGPYRYVRNPMYIGATFALLGQLVIAPAWDLLAYIVLWFAAVAVVVVSYEEPTLHARFGDSYWRYKTHVRRWLPRFGRPYDAEVTHRDG